MARLRDSEAIRVWLLRLVLVLLACVTPAAWGQDGGETGRYFALVIGIDKYPAPVPQLQTAVGDARAVAQVLEKQYGFQVTLLTDGEATRNHILDRLTAYQGELKATDNLLIYYAGHGFRIDAANKSFWLPADAASMQSSNRISSDDLTTEMATLKARHVLVISDSCYSGGLTRGLDEGPDIRANDEFLRKTLAIKSRNIMASGRDEPVADGGPDGHSIFAWAVLQALSQQMEGLFTASTLFYGKVQRAVAGNSEQIPVYQPIRNSGDIGGDFVFRRVRATVGEVRERLSAAATGFDRGEALYRSKDFERAASAYMVGCIQEDPRACTRLSTIYANGLATQDIAQAVALFRKGCDGGVAGGCSNLGVMYDFGRGVTQDSARAVTLFRKGCDGSDAGGCSNLGVMYDHGRGVTKDVSQAVALYRKACDGGDTVGCAELGFMYEKGHGVAQDVSQAVALYGKACDSGLAGVCYILGEMYENGRGVRQDNAQAVALFRKGCDGGSPTGCSDLGYMYDKGIGVTRDDSQAVSLYRKGCDGGNAAGCSNLGVMYDNGTGVAQNYLQAVTFFRRACHDAVTEGCSNLAEMYANGRGVTRDDSQAVTLYRNACDGGDADGCSNLKRMQAGQRPQ